MNVVLIASCSVALTTQVASAQPIDLAPVIAAREAGDFVQAIQLLEAADAAQPNDPQILRLLGTSYAFVQRFDEAIEVLIPKCAEDDSLRGIPKGPEI